MINNVKDQYEDGVCPDCGEDIPEDSVFEAACDNCGHVFTKICPNDEA